MTGEHSQAGPLDRSGGQPLYAQLAQQLADEIRRQRLVPGAALPSEAALCKRFGVARSVVRQALSVLLAENLIQREQGRPAIVAPRTEHRRLVQRSTGLYEQFASVGTVLRTRILRLETATPPQDVAGFFGTGALWLLERLRSIDGLPIAYVQTWLPRSRMPDLRASELEDASLHRVLDSRYGIHPGRGRNRIRAVGASASLASLLQVDPGSPLLMLEGQGHDQEGLPMEWFTTWHRAEQLVFDVEVGTDTEQVQLSRPAEEGIPAIGRVKDPLDEVEQMLGAALSTLQRARRQG